MIQIIGIRVDVPYPCDSCGAIKNVLTEVKFIYKRDAETNQLETRDVQRNKGIKLSVYLCYRCRNTLHSSLGKHIQTFAGPY